jgi:crotonobetainyl-CoA:carnitine CoA-transferase CaiB-like acyl-CoA transferase
MLGCADGAEVMLAVGTDRQFLALGQALEISHQLEGYAKNAQRVSGREALRSILEAASQKLDSRELLRRLEQAGVPAGKLQTVSEALSRSEDCLLRADEMAGVRSLAFSGPTRRELAPPPRLGEHQEEVLRDWLEN